MEPVGGPDNLITYAAAADWQKTINYMNSSNGLPRRYMGLLMPLMNCGADDPNLPTPPTNMILESFNGGGERDIYHVNILGSTVKFYLEPITNKVVIIGEKSRFKIEKTNNNWKVVDDLGYQYFFNAYEYFRYDGNFNQLVNTWHLTDIVYQGKTLLKIAYVTRLITPMPEISDVLVHKEKETSEIERQTRYVSEFYARYPQYLLTPLDSIVFNTESRVDLRNGLALKFLRVYNRKNKNQLKEVEFVKDYFAGTAVGTDASTLDYVTKRLKLNQVVIRGVGDGGQKYTFTYHSQPLPYKNSFAQDFLGYYNGQNNAFSGQIIGLEPGSVFSANRTLLPTPASLLFQEEVPLSIKTFKAANRGVNSNYIAAGVLKSITYPTGGKTEFDFEPHTINNATYPESGQHVISESLVSVINNGNSSFSTPSTSFTLTKDMQAKIKVTITGKTFNITDFNAFSVVLVTKANSPSPIIKRYYIATSEQIQQYNSTKTVTIEEDVTLPAGLVVFAATVGSGMPDQGYTFNNGTRGELSYFSFIDTAQHYDSYVGGLRVKQIRNYESDGVLSGTQNYEYAEEDGRPSGKLVHPIKFTHRQSTRYQKESPEGGVSVSETRLYDYLFSDNFYSYSNSYAPAQVGYSRVVVKATNTGGQHNGMIIKTFQNTPAANYYLGTKKFIPNNLYHTALNGRQLKEIYLKSNLDTVSVEEKAYAINNIDHYYQNVAITDLYVGPKSCGARTSLVNSNRFDVIVSSYSSFSVQLNTNRLRRFAEGGRVTSLKTYEYDPYNYKTSAIREITSGGSSIIERFKYPLNYPESDYLYLRAGNMVGVPVERIVSQNNNVIGYYKADYKLWGSVVAPEHIYDMDANSNPYRILTYLRYDAYGNPLELRKHDGPLTTYLWGYDGQYLVAGIENASYSEVTGTGVSLPVLDNVGATDEQKTTELSKIRNHPSMKKAQVTTYTYKPSVGMSSRTDASGRTLRYEYDSSGRLLRIRDHQNNVVEEYNYHYRP